jgi:hypothetical protein
MGALRQMRYVPVIDAEPEQLKSWVRPGSGIEAATALVVLKQRRHRRAIVNDCVLPLFTTLSQAGAAPQLGQRDHDERSRP